MGNSPPVRPVKKQAVRASARLRTISSQGVRREGKRPREKENDLKLIEVSPSYVAALELRIEKLERRLAYAQSRKASLSMHETADTGPAPEPPHRKDSLAAIREAIHRNAARKRENSDVNHLVSDFGYMSAPPAQASLRLYHAS